MLRKFFSPLILTAMLCGALLNSVILANADWTMVQVKHNDFPVFKDVYFADKKNGWVAGVSGFGDDGMVFNTRDGGATWELQELPANVKTLSRLFFVSPKVGWAVGQDGTIVATKNAGKTWDFQTSKVGNWLFDVFFINENVGWTVGDTETVLKTTNGGKTWKILKGGKPASGVGEGEVALTGICFVDENTGWAVGQGGLILHTTDGGANWEKQENIIEDNLNSLFFLDENTGCAVGEDGSIVRTTDAGAKWNLPKSGRDEEFLEKLFRVCFAPNPLETWVSGTDGTILHTTDGGDNWEKQDKLVVEIMGKKISFSQEITSVFALDAKQCWAVGQDWVFKYTK